MRTRRTLVAAAVSLSLLAAACGSSDDGGSSDTTADTTADTEAPPASEAPPESDAAPTTDAAPATDAPPDTDAPAPESDVEYNPDGEVRLGFLFVPTSMDPHTVRHIGDRHAMLPVWDSLVELGNDQSVIPSLAESWEFNDEGTVITFTMRDDVTFHDGSPVNAEAARASIERVLTDTETVSPATRGYLQNVASVEAPDDVTLVVNLIEANAGTLGNFATAAGMVINPAYLDTDLTVPPPEASSGAYVVTDFTPDVTVSYERAPTVWKADQGVGRMAKLTIDSYLDTQAGMNALETGQLDITFARADREVIEAVLERNPDLVFSAVPSGPGPVFQMRNTIAPLDNIEVRKAIMHGLDFAKIGEFGSGPDCAPATQWFPKTAAGYVEGYEPFPYDPELAKQMIADAGAEGASLDLMVAPDQPAEARSGQIIQQMLEDIGLKIEIVPVAFAEAPARWNEGKDALYIQSGAGVSDIPSAIDGVLFGQSNLAGPEAADYEKVVKAALAPGDDRVERTVAAHKVGMEAALYQPTCFQTSRFLATSEMVGVEEMPLRWTGVFDPKYLAINN